jgi:hypothetical protein
MKFSDALIRTAELLGSAEFKERAMGEDPAMIKYTPLLQQINLAGYLTTDSQSGKHAKGINKDTRKPYDIQERAYICGYMPEGNAEKFIKYMAIYTDKIAVYIPVCANDIHIPAALDLPVTLQTNDGVKSVATHLSMAIPVGADEVFRREAHLNKRDKAVYVCCWDTHWGRLADGKHGLFTEVLQVLKELKA